MRETGFVKGILKSMGVAEEALWQQTGFNTVVYFAAVCGIGGDVRTIGNTVAEELLRFRGSNLQSTKRGSAGPAEGMALPF